MTCDVFSAKPLKGNGLAVVVDGDSLSDKQMQDFARWINLAETTFLSAPTISEADYKAKIFTPARELPFAGHPTLGSCVAWLDAGGKPQKDGLVVQECGIGTVEVDITSQEPAFRAPVTEVSLLDLPDQQRIVQALGLEECDVLNAVELVNGPVWKVLELTSASCVLNVDASRVTWPEFQAIGLFGRANNGSETDFEVRMLAPSSGMAEDPITGSLIAAIAEWLRVQGRLTDKIAVSQGVMAGRCGRAFVSPGQDGSVWVGGGVKTITDGTLYL